MTRDAATPRRIGRRRAGDSVNPEAGRETVPGQLGALHGGRARETSTQNDEITRGSE